MRHGRWRCCCFLKAVPSHSKILVNGSEAKLSESPVVIQNKLYVPLRDFSEALEYQIGSVGADAIGMIPKSSNGEATAYINKNSK
ncbi:stalk domain-containing protein [Paenibacillus lautus]|uniref:stalk domain-containing protein n=1 Tax=Paenibacillus lautus TaxID=1401 RepID=UPI002DBDE9AA|nr:stalk domain-containing protein [Paenibacillus lautus]